MVFKMAAMGYHQIDDTDFVLTWLLMDQNYDLLINDIEFYSVQYGIRNGRHFPHAKHKTVVANHRFRLSAAIFKAIYTILW